MSGRPPTSPLFPYTTLFRSLEAGGEEDAVEALRLGRALDQSRSRHDPRGHHRAPPLGDARRRAQIVETAVGARADEHAIRSEEHTSELQSREKLVCRLLLEK